MVVTVQRTAAKLPLSMPYFLVSNPTEKGGPIDTMSADGVVKLAVGASVVLSKDAADDLKRRYGFLEVSETSQAPEPPKVPVPVHIEGVLLSDIAQKVVEQHPTLHIVGASEETIAVAEAPREKRKYARRTKPEA